MLYSGWQEKSCRLFCGSSTVCDKNLQKTKNRKTVLKKRIFVYGRKRTITDYYGRPARQLVRKLSVEVRNSQ